MPFQKGQSGNPSGRPKTDSPLRVLARAHTQEALDTLVSLMRSAEAEAVRERAAEALLDRGWGKPQQSVDVSGQLTIHDAPKTEAEANAILREAGAEV